MNRKNMVKSNINKFGQKVTITVPEQDNRIIETKAFIQPLRQTSKLYQQNNYLDSGFVDMSNYLYIGPYDIRLDNFPGDIILESDLKKYIVQKVDTVSVEDEIIYIRAVLRIYTEGDTNILA